MKKYVGLYIYKFKRLEKPKSMNRQMLMRLFDAYGISSGLLARESTYAAGLEALLKAAKDKLDAAWAIKNFLNKHYDLWGGTMERVIPLPGHGESIGKTARSC